MSQLSNGGSIYLGVARRRGLDLRDCPTVVGTSRVQVHRLTCCRQVSGNQELRGERPPLEMTSVVHRLHR